MEQFHNAQGYSDIALKTLAQVTQLRASINESHPDLINRMRQQLFNLPALNEHGEEIIDPQTKYN